MQHSHIQHCAVMSLNKSGKYKVCTHKHNNPFTWEIIREPLFQFSDHSVIELISFCCSKLQYMFTEEMMLNV